MGGRRAKRAGVSGAKPLTARNPAGITLSALLLSLRGAFAPLHSTARTGAARCARWPPPLKVPCTLATSNAGKS